MFYLILVPTIFALGWQALYLRELKKHDIHLFRFCRLRRDIIEYIFDNRETLSPADYADIRKILQIVTDTIWIYKDHKTVMFDFRLMSKYLSDAESFSGEIERISPKNPDIIEFAGRFEDALVQGFLAYTPFLKHELTVKIVLASLRALSSIGNSKIKKIIERINEATTFIRSRPYKECHG